MNIIKQNGDLSFSKLYSWETKIYSFLEKVYDFLIRNLRIIAFVGMTLSILFGILKTTLYHGFNVDGYQYFALSIEEFIRTGEMNYLFVNYYVRNRIVYPFIIAIIHIIIPIDISILACCVNLIFAVLSIFTIRKILLLLKFNEKVVDLSTLIISTSYTILNYWFQILSDITALCFFLLFLYFLLKFKFNRNYFDLCFSIVFLLYAVLAREHFIMAILLYLYLINKWKIRVIILLSFTCILIILLWMIPAYIPLTENFIAPSYLQTFYDKELLKLYFLLQKKWLYEGYFIGFMKGLLKVGIMPSLLLLLIFNLDKFHLKRKNNKRKISVKDEMLTGWFVIFLSIYLLVYSNITSPTGLRYLLPVVWIPIFYASNIIIRNKTAILFKTAISTFRVFSFNNSVIKRKMLKSFNLLLVLFLTLYPIGWSSVEMYINRDYGTGTGPLYKFNTYTNDMLVIDSVSKVDWNDLWLDPLNETLFVTTLKHNLNESNYNNNTGRIFLTFWLEVNNSITINIKLKSCYNANWGFSLHEIREDFYNKLGKLQYTISHLRAFDTFQIYEIYIDNIDQPFILRDIALITTGPSGGKIFWDWIEIKAT
ncbi:MAG: hypothetical protein HZR80_13780 [Candidatus Heimdallarchaeota archaeon]